MSSEIDAFEVEETEKSVKYNEKSETSKKSSIGIGEVDNFVDLGDFPFLYVFFFTKKCEFSDLQIFIFFSHDFSKLKNTKILICRLFEPQGPNLIQCVINTLFRENRENI